MVFTSLAVTHPNILPSHRSSKLHSSPSQQMEMLPYRSVIPKRTRIAHDACDSERCTREPDSNRRKQALQACAFSLLAIPGSWREGVDKTRQRAAHHPGVTAPGTIHARYCSTRTWTAPSHDFPFWNHRTHNFCTMLSPYTFSAHSASCPKARRVVSYYALFK